MKTLHKLTGYGIAALALLAGCARDTTAPRSPAARVDGGSGTPIVANPAKHASQLAVGALWRDEPLDAAEVESKVIGTRGGRIHLAAADFDLIVPAGALDAPTRITVAALAGKAIAYEFEPHGLTFHVPLVFSQRLGKTSWDHVRQGTAEGGYFATPDLLNEQELTATVAELFPLTLDVVNSTVQFEIPHFSGYMVTSGRKGNGPPSGGHDDDDTSGSRGDEFTHVPHDP